MFRNLLTNEIYYNPDTTTLDHVATVLGLTIFPVHRRWETPVIIADGNQGYCLRYRRRTHHVLTDSVPTGYQVWRRVKTRGQVRKQLWLDHTHTVPELWEAIRTEYAMVPTDD